MVNGVIHVSNGILEDEEGLYVNWLLYFINQTRNDMNNIYYYNVLTIQVI